MHTSLSLLVGCLAAASAFVAQPAAAPGLRAARAVSPVCQFGTGNTESNGFDEKGNPNFFLSPIAGGSKDYPYGQYELDTSGGILAIFFALFFTVAFPVLFAVGIVTTEI